MAKIFQQTGIIDNDGQIQKFDGELSEYLRANKQKHVIISYQIYEPDTSAGLIGYYTKYVVPMFVRAFTDLGNWYTNDEVDAILRSASPVTNPKKWNGKTWVNDIAKIREMGNTQMVAFLEWCKWYGAENFCICIEDPKK